MKMARYPLPTEYEQALGSDWVQQANTKPNFALILQKVQPWRKTGDMWALLGGGGEDDNVGKSVWLRRLETHAEYPDQELFRAFEHQWEGMVKAYGAEPHDLATASNLIVGFGAESTLENGIMLHRPTGLPIIPGSACKGLCRAVCLASIATEFGISPVPIEQALAELANPDPNHKKLVTPGWHTLAEMLQGLPDDQQKALDKLTARGNNGALTDLAAFNASPSVCLFRQLFGETGRAGKLIFFDAIPKKTDKKLFVADVLTPHFGKYYGDGIAPNDDLEPSPNVFLVVPEDLTFRFAIGYDQGRDSNLAKIAWGWLRFALFTLGIGAKTNAGYGRFKEVS